MRSRRSPPLSSLVALAAAALVALAGARGAQAATIDRVRECVEANRPHSTAVQTVRIRTEDDDGLVEERRVHIAWRRDADGEAHTVVRLISPPELAGTAVLVVESTSGLREVHLHLPEIGKTRRLRSAAQLEGLLGVRGIGLDEIDGLVALVERPGLLLVSESEVLGGRETWVVEARSADEPPHAERLVGYIDRELCVALRVDVYRNSDRPTARILTDAGDLLETAHVRVPRIIVAEDLVGGSRTTLTIETLEVDGPLVEEGFRVEALSAPGG